MFKDLHDNSEEQLKRDEARAAAFKKPAEKKEKEPEVKQPDK
jgi:hypothetical protein